jgi:hypothetical protein
MCTRVVAIRYSRTIRSATAVTIRYNGAARARVAHAPSHAASCARNSSCTRARERTSVSPRRARSRAFVLARMRTRVRAIVHHASQRSLTRKVHSLPRACDPDRRVAIARSGSIAGATRRTDEEVEDVIEEAA